MELMTQLAVSSEVDLSYEQLCIALFVNDQLYSHEEIQYYVQRLAAWLKENHIKQLGIYASRSLEAYIGVLAAFYAGVTYLPINPKLPSERIAAILQETQLDAIVLDSNCEALIKKIPFEFNKQNQLGPEFFSTMIPKLSPLCEPAEKNSNDTAYIIFTSGSTGKPKGIEVTYGNVWHYVSVMQERYQLNEFDRVGQYNELSFDLSVFDIMMAWRANATLYVVPESQLLSPAKFIQENEITVWLSVPSIIHFMKKLNHLKKNSLPSLKWSCFCGEALLVDYAKSWQSAASNSVIENLYGPAELTISCLLYRFNRKTFPSDVKQFVPIGSPNEGLMADIIDENHQFVARGQSGELAIAGPQVAKGYYNNSVLTEKKFITLNHPIYGEQRWYCTGDRCVRDLHGHYQYLGRMDNQHKVLGYRIELEEIEYYLRKISETEEVVVVIITNDNQVNELVGVVCKKNIDIHLLKNELRKKLPSYMVPNKIELWTDLPRNIHGKINRNQVREQLRDSLCFGEKSSLI